MAENLERLVAGYLDGDLDAAGRRELAELLERELRAAREFDEALRLEALLVAAHCAAPPAARLRPRLGRPRRWWWPSVAAAAVLAAALGAWLGSREPAGNRLLSGRVTVAGREVRRIPDGEPLEVFGKEPAVLRLADGSRAEFAAGSRAVLRSKVEGLRQVVTLESGKGHFRVEKEEKRFRVETPVGRVTVLGTEFSVGLRPFDFAQGRSVEGPEQAEGPAASKGDGAMRGKTALVMIVAVTAGMVSVEYEGKTDLLTAGAERAFGGERERPRREGLPEGVRGFSGMVRGAVVAKGERHTFTFKVGRVLKTWEGSKARRPQALVGLTVKVGPRWEKRGGKWRPVEVHVAFIRKLKPGQEMTLEVRNVERDHFSILELSEEQRKLALGGGEGEKEKGEGEKEKEEGEGEGKEEAEEKAGLPEGVRGFSGMVRGAVVAKGERHTFTFKVGRVLKTWEGSKARRPQALVGLTVKVGPRWEKRGGKWRPVEVHAAFIRKLKPGHEFNLQVRNAERDHFAILELAKEQREWALRGGEGEKKEEGKKEEDKEGGKKEEPKDDWDF